jgi:mercuric ion binding protein
MTMKTALSLFAGFAFILSASAADVSVTLSNVHLCCKKCVNGVNKALKPVDGDTATVDQDAGTVQITGPDTATVQKGVDALVAAGYFGTSSDPSIKVDASTGASGKQVQTLEVKGVHVCCKSCVKAINEAVMGVPGVTGDTAAPGAKTFEVTGNFNDQAVFDALQKIGVTGKVAQ